MNIFKKKDYERIVKPHIEGFPRPDCIVVHHYPCEPTIVHAEWWSRNGRVYLEVSMDKPDFARWFKDDGPCGTETLIEREDALAKVDR